MGKRRKRETGKEASRPKPARGVRSFWSGTLSFGLVNVPVQLFPAQRHNRRTLRLLAPDGTPLSRRYFCPKHGRDVHPEHLLRGFELESGEYVLIRDEELEAIEPKKSREIDLRQFVDLAEISPLLYERAYFLTPTGDSNKAYRLLAEVMEETALAGIATFVMRDKEYLIAVLAERGILRAETLRFQDELRGTEEMVLPDNKSADPNVANQIAQAIKHHSSSKLDIETLQDARAQRLERLLARKLKSGRDVVQASTAERDGDDGEEDAAPHVDLLETIRRSLSTGGDRQESKLENSAHPEELAALSKNQLYERAKARDIEGRSSMSKNELIASLRDP